MNPLAIPEIVIRRLPLYLRTLNLLASRGQTVTSSQELGNRLGTTSTQIRKDLSYFGEFGKQGTGYAIHHLQEQLRSILQIDRRWNVALVGAGELGHALLDYRDFEKRGFPITAVFDSDKAKIGCQAGSLKVLDIATLPEVIREQRVRIAIIAVPASEAQEVAHALVDAGVRAILCYAPITLTLPDRVRAHYVDPILGLQSMAYSLNPDQA